MSVDLYSTYYLNGVLSTIPSNPTFILDNYFKKQVQHHQKEVVLDKVEKKPRVTPYVHPLKEGKVIEHSGYETFSIQPAYLKDKRVFTPEDGLNRYAGEAIGGSLSPQQRLRLHIMSTLQDQLNMMKRRWEVMALEAVKTGKLVINGDGYTTDQVIDFKRDPELDIVAKKPWTDLKTNVVDQFEEWSLLMHKKAKTNARINTVLLGLGAWKHFRKLDQVQELLDKRRGDASTIQLSPAQDSEGVEFKGWFGEFPLYLYNNTYNDSITGEEKLYIEDNEVLLLSQALNGSRHFGAIYDLKKLVPAKVFSKSWYQEDPSVQNLLMQSAPLMVPYNPNATMRIKVYA